LAGGAGICGLPVPNPRRPCYREGNTVREFFDPIPLWVVGLVIILALPIGVLLSMPSAWADRFFRTMFRLFDKKP
jgi:hypothetical protein